MFSLVAIVGFFIASAAAEAPVAAAVAPAVITSRSSQVISRNFNALVAPYVAAAPLQALPVQAAPLQVVPVQAANLQLRAAPLQAAPVQAVPIQAAAVQAAALKAVPVQAVPLNAIPAQSARLLSSPAASQLRAAAPLASVQAARAASLQAAPAVPAQQVQGGQYRADKVGKLRQPETRLNPDAESIEVVSADGVQGAQGESPVAGKPQKLESEKVQAVRGLPLVATSAAVSNFVSYASPFIYYV